MVTTTPLRAIDNSQLPLTKAITKRKRSTISSHGGLRRSDRIKQITQEISPLADDGEEHAAPPKKRRGRPPKGNPGVEGGVAATKLQLLPNPNLPNDPTLPLSKLQDVVLDPLPFPGKRSPSKTGSTKPPAEVVTKDQLAYMTPPIRFLTSRDLKSHGCHLAPIIPNSFKVKDRLRTISNTPMKSRPEVRQECFGSAPEYDAYDHELIWLTVMDVASMAEEYRTRTTESHWISVVNPLLHLIRRLKRPHRKEVLQEQLLEVVDITTTQISPSSLCPYSENLSLLKDLDKGIDCAVGLRLSTDERYILQRGQYFEDCKPSINQTSSFVNLTPMFVNIEVERFLTDKDPMIQLAAWIAAEFKKRLCEKYSLDMPVLAIAILGDIWHLYIAYATRTGLSNGYRCDFIGPFDMGSTTNHEGIFKILNCLWRLTSWGLEEYRPWFEAEILAKYR